ncbi:hypothetical protein A2U01_0098426, partial [Trifolium medium]|nr:hypothetical protein [Trifolium medium]
MRESEEREGVEKREAKRFEDGNAKVHRRKGFVHRLDKETTSFFFTNIPEDAT